MSSFPPRATEMSPVGRAGRVGPLCASRSDARLRIYERRKKMRTRLLVFALMTILVAGSLHAEQLPEVNDVRSELEAARAAVAASASSYGIARCSTR